RVSACSRWRSHHSLAAFHEASLVSSVPSWRQETEYHLPRKHFRQRRLSGTQVMCSFFATSPSWQNLAKSQCCIRSYPRMGDSARRVWQSFGKKWFGMWVAGKTFGERLSLEMLDFSVFTEVICDERCALSAFPVLHLRPLGHLSQTGPLQLHSTRTPV